MYGFQNMYKSIKKKNPAEQDVHFKRALKSKRALLQHWTGPFRKFLDVVVVGLAIRETYSQQRERQTGGYSFAGDLQRSLGSFSYVDMWSAQLQPRVTRWTHSHDLFFSACDLGLFSGFWILLGFSQVFVIFIFILFFTCKAHRAKKHTCASS